MQKRKEEFEDSAKLETEEVLDEEEEEEENSDYDKDEMEIDEKDENDDDDDVEAGPSDLGSDGNAEKKKKRGIIYISSIPKFMNVTILREMLSEYAKIGRVYLQPGKLSGKLR